MVAGPPLSALCSGPAVLGPAVLATALVATAAVGLIGGRPVAALSTANQAAIDARAVIAGKAAAAKTTGTPGWRVVAAAALQPGRDRHGERRLGHRRLVGLDRDGLHRRGAPDREPAGRGCRSRVR